MTTIARGVSYTFSRCLFSIANPGSFQDNPTISEEDFKISKDNGAFANLSNTPVVTPAGSALVKFTLTALETNASNIDIYASGGPQWTGLHESFDTTQEPTAFLLTRDWTSLISAAASYSVLNALRFLRNDWAISAGTPPTLDVFAEDGLTVIWSKDLTTDATAEPIIGVS